LSAQAAIAAGGLLLTWGYRRWSRRKKADADKSRIQDEIKAQADRLADKFHSLDKEAPTSHIPKDLETEPKNLEQSIHPG
jgi:hypothetical protein